MTPYRVKRNEWLNRDIAVEIGNVSNEAITSLYPMRQLRHYINPIRQLRHYIKWGNYAIISNEAITPLYPMRQLRHYNKWGNYAIISNKAITPLYPIRQLRQCISPGSFSPGSKKKKGFFFNYKLQVLNNYTYTYSTILLSN